MDMVEKVARAIYEALKAYSYSGYVGVQGDGCVEGFTVLDGDFHLTAVARTAIEAMRWPTPEMVKAGAEEFKIMNVEAFTQDVWDAMIDAALKATPASE